MSTIMKALKRLEKDRVAERDRPLRDEVLASAPHRGSAGGEGISRMILGAALGVLASAALLGGWLFWGEDLGTRPVEIATPDPPAPPPLTLAKATTLPAVVEPPAPRPAPPPTLRRPAPAAAPPEVSARPAERVAVISETVKPQTEQVKPPIEPAASPVKEIRNEEPLRPAAPEPVPVEVEPTLEEEKFLVDALLEEAIAAEAERRIEARQVSVEFSVQRTVWHPRAEQREAFIQIPPDESLQRVREGDVIGSAVVLSIEPAAVVLERDGVETRKRVGSP